MLELFGRQWEASYGHVDGKAYTAWRDAMTQFTPDEVGRGLRALIDEGSEFPPNLIKFMRLCRTPVPPSPGDGGLKALSHKKLPRDNETAVREMLRQVALMAGECNETKEQSYNRLGLAARWGKLGA